MIVRFRQETGTADVVRVAMVCLVATILMGFSIARQQPVAEASADYPVLSIAGSVGVESISSSGSVQRPGSLADTVQLKPVLGRIDSHLWLAPVANTLDLSLPTIDKSPELFFRGVGFPDIRTYDRGRRSVSDVPDPWVPLVVWRNQNSEQGAAEPIASVRCMGLSPQAVARRADRYREMIYTVAQQHDVSPHLVKAVITEESCFDNKALSPVGAQGLMQLMPDTASWLDVSDPHDPVQNLSGGIRYLASLQKQFDTVELALAAYNAGPGNVRRYNGVPPFAETQAYVVKVQAHYRRYEAVQHLLGSNDDTLE